MATSPSELIQERVVQALLAGGIPNIGDSSHIYTRELPQRQKGDHDRSLIVVMGNETPMRRGDPLGQRSTMSVGIIYPALVLWTYKRAQSEVKYFAQKKEVRWKIWTTLYNPYTLNLPELIKDCDYISEPKFTAIGFEEGYKYSSQLFLYKTDEPCPPGRLNLP